MCGKVEVYEKVCLQLQITPFPRREYVQNGMKGSTQSFSIRLRLQTGTCIFCRPCPWATVEHILPRRISRELGGRSRREGKRQKKEEKKEKEWPVVGHTRRVYDGSGL